MEDAPRRRLIVSMDCRELGLDQRASRCDFLFFSDSGNVVAALELKRGKYEAEQLRRQLQAGANLASSLAPTGNHVRFVPVAAHGRGAHRDQMLRLAKARIRFRQARVRIELLKCGDALVQAIKKAGVDWG